MEYEILMKLYKILLTINLQVKEHIYNFFRTYFIFLDRIIRLSYSSRIRADFDPFLR
jgi:hypothetical protein